jgi:hypothetical protein
MITDAECEQASTLIVAENAAAAKVATMIDK